MDLATGLRDSLRDIMGIRKGAVALIVHDEYAKQVSETTKKALELEGIEVYLYALPETERPLKSTPDDLRELMETLRPDLFFNQLRGYAEETPFRINLHNEENLHGAKVGHSPDITMDMIRYPMTADFREIKRNADSLKRRFKGAKTLRLTAPAGTDLVFSIVGRAFKDDLTIRPGRMGNLPAGELWLAPVERSMNGTIVVDGSIGDVGQVRAPLTICVRDGKVFQLSSDDQELVTLVTGLLNVDEDASLAGEFGIGLNPKARLTGLLLEDEKAYGTLHIAFGQNTDMPGGRNNSMTHRDFLFKSPTIIIQETGEVIMKDGKLT